MKTFLEHIEQQYGRKNWRVTAGVRNMAQVFEQAIGLLSVHDIQEALKKMKRALDLTTVYRIVDRLESLDLIHLIDGKYARCTDPLNQDDHHFLLCHNCSKAEEIFLDYRASLQGQLKEEKGFHLEDVKLVFYGLCKDCKG